MNRLAQFPGELSAKSQSLLGIHAIFEELNSHHISPESIFTGTNLTAGQMHDATARMSLSDRLRIYKNASKITLPNSIALAAGRRQRVSDYGLFGFALASSATLGEALSLGIRYPSLSGATMEIRSRLESGALIFSSHGFQILDDALIFGVEFWRSSINTLLSIVAGKWVPSRLMVFPYKAPPHWRTYKETFRCQLEFEEGVMEWHFHESALAQRCPGANSITAQMCALYCDRMTHKHILNGHALVRRIQLIHASSNGSAPSAEEVATDLGMSKRSLFRRLASLGLSYQAVSDDIRNQSAVDLLRNTSLSTAEIGRRLGFSDGANFSKAFKRWNNGRPPSQFRSCFEKH